MNCPRDGATLREVRIDEVVLDRCPVCGGVWFDFALLERVVIRESRSLKKLMPEKDPPEEPDSEYLTCPRCSDVLIRMRGDMEPRKYYGCLTCYGRWLDGEEIERIIGSSLLAKCQRLFEELLR